jgi:hypothetical protein
MKIGSAEFTFDRAATQQAFSAIEKGAPERCGCSYCRNFVAAREQVYSPPVVALLEQLGIDRTKEAETWQYCRIRPRVQQYGGFFHFCGSLVSGGDEMIQIGASAWWHKIDYAQIAPGFEAGISSRPSLVEEPFKSKPILELCFTAEVPWLIAEPEPTLTPWRVT